MSPFLAVSCALVVRLGVVGALLATAGLGGRPASAAPPPAAAANAAGANAANASADKGALFALIVGVNRNPERDQPPLRYADDDAARFLDLFQTLGARTTLLSTLDENTRVIHPRAAAESKPARREDLLQAVASLAQAVREARAQGLRTTFYVIYAGHGDVDNDELALTLEDGHLDADHLLSEVVLPTAADESHVIIDACHAYLFALPRGPGGTRRPVEGFAHRVARLPAGDPSSRVGFLLASSANGDSHEWSGFESGVFSHEVRSGLYGAADADGNGIVTYSEIAAFVTRANAGIKAERFRPQVIAQPPRNGGALLDLRPHQRDLRFEGPTATGHFLLEDTEGVRLADFHSSGRVPVELIRPGDGLIYVRRLPSGEERAVPATKGLVGVMDLPLEPPRDRPRGAAAHAFAQTFALPFDAANVAAYEGEVLAKSLVNDGETARRPLRGARLGGAVAFGVSAGLLVTAGAFEVAALSARNFFSPETLTGEQTEDRAPAVRARNHWAAGAAIGAGLSALVGSYLLWRF